MSAIIVNVLSAQDEGEYAEALNNYYQALQIEEDLYDRSINPML